MKELELKSLFETIRAINSNASEQDLYRIYKFIIRANTYITKLALYVLDKQWECKVHYGTEHDYLNIPLDAGVKEYKEIDDFTLDIPYFNEFHKIIPVKHKNNVLAYVFLSISSEDDEDRIELEFLDALSNIIIVAIENKKLVRKEQKQQEYNRQLEIAKNVQSLLFPKLLPNNGRITVEASYLPHHTVGGDYYDYIEISPNKFLVCIADVSGKGMPAAILMSNFQAGLRILSRKSTDLFEIVNELNLLIMQNSQGENFITAFFMLYDFETKNLFYVNAGHNPPFLFVKGEVKRLEKGTTILGGFKKLPFLQLGIVEDLSNAMVFCFTDGFTETYNDEGDEFGEEYLEKFLIDNFGIEQAEMHMKLIALLNTFKGNNVYVDDITLLSCRIK